MALISCPECDKQISSKASSCPVCGHPIAAQTIEVTAKKWKAIQLISGGWLTVSIFVILTSLPEEISAFWLYSAIICFLAFVGAKFGAWWDHG